MKTPLSHTIHRRLLAWVCCAGAVAVPGIAMGQPTTSSRPTTQPKIAQVTPGAQPSPSLADRPVVRPKQVTPEEIDEMRRRAEASTRKLSEEPASPARGSRFSRFKPKDKDASKTETPTAVPANAPVAPPPPGVPARVTTPGAPPPGTVPPTAQPPSTPTPAPVATVPAKPITTIPAVARAAPEHRKYLLSFQGAKWEEVLNTFCRLTGLTIIGQYPRELAGGITYINPRELNYQEAMHEINMLLMEQGGNYWMAREKNHLILRRLADWPRYIPAENNFDSIDLFEKAKLEDDDWAMVFYTPQEQVLGDLITNILTTMPDNVIRAAPVGETNRIKITGIVFYVRQFLKLANNPMFKPDQYDAQKQRQIKFYKIERAQAQSIQGVLERIIIPPARMAIGGAADEANRVEMILEPMSNTIIVKANAKMHREIESIIKQIETAEIVAEATPTFIELKAANAVELANLLNPLLQQQSSMRPVWKRGEIDRERVFIQPDAASNTLIVLATKEGMKRVEPLLKQLDVATPDVNYKRIMVQNARADQVFTMMNQILMARANARRGRGVSGPQPQVFIDSQTNALYVMAPPKDMEYIEKIIKELDSADAERNKVHILKLKKARPSAAQQTITAIFGQDPRFRRATPGGGLLMFPDDNAQVLTIICTDKDWKEIDTAIKQFEAEAISVDPVTRTFALKDGDAEEIAQILNNVIAGRAGRMPVRIVADRKNNTLFVTALESSFEEVESLIKKLDLPTKEGQLEILPLENAQANEVANLLAQMFADRGGSRFARGGSTAPQIIPDPIANALIVRATKSDLAEIEIQAARLDDAAKVVGTKPQIIQLEYADPVQVASLCQAMFVQSAARARQADRTTFFQPHRTGLIIRAPQQQMKEIQDFIKTLDSPEVENIEVKTVHVPGQNLTQLVSTLQQVFSAERGRRGGGSINFMPNPDAEMIVITAPKKRFEEIDKLIKQYTEGVKVSTATMKMYDLKNARVDEVVELLNRMLGAALTRGGYSAAARQFQILPETRQNKLVIFAPDTIMKQAEDMIKQLDVPLDKDAGSVRWIVLENTDATTIASTLTGMWGERSVRGRTSFRSLPIQIWPEPITNSVLVSAPADDFKEIEKLAKELDNKVKVATTQPSIIKMEYADPPYVVAMCRAMFIPQAQSGYGRRLSVSTEGISFEAMQNGVLVRAPTTRMETIKGFIKSIDVPSEARMAVKTWHLPGLNVEQIHQTLTAVFSRAARRREEPPMSFLVDSPRETIIVTADTSRFTEIEKVIADFKATASTEEPSIQEMVPVKHTRASYAASILDDMLRKRLAQRSKRLAERLSITVEDRQNKVILYAPKDVLQLAKTILAELDVPVSGPTTQEAGVDMQLVKWIPLQHVDATSAASTITTIWAAATPPAKTNENRPPVRIWAETITNHVLVAGAFGKDFQEIERIAKDIDAKAVENPNKPEHIVLNFASPSEVASICTAMFVPTGIRAKQSVMIQPVSDGVIIRAPKVQLKEIQDFIKSYDTPESSTLRIRTYHFPQANVSELASTLTTVFGYKKRRRDEPGWSFIPNTSTDMLMVLAPENRFKEIDDVVKQYTDAQQKTESKMQLLDIKHMRASDVYSTLSSMLTEKLRRSFGQKAVSQLQLSYEPRQNKLVVFAPDELMKQVEEMVKQIDVELKDDSEEIKWIPIEFADAYEVSSTVQSFFARKQGSSKQRQNFDFRDVQVWPELVTNSLLVSAPKKEFDEIEKLAKKIDTEYAEKGLERIKITPKYVSASQVQTMVQQLFVNARRRDVRNQMQQIKVIPAGTYSFFLEAPKDKLPAIKKMIEEMDTEGENTPIIKTYKMGDANVTELARALSVAMGGIGSYIPEPRRGVLIVSAPKQHFERIEKTLQELKADIQEEEKRFEVITLKFARPSSVYSMISQLVSLQLSERRSRSGRSLELSVIPDDNNNRLFVHAAGDEMALVKKMLEQLDVENLRKDAELHTITLKRTDCTYMTSKISQVFTSTEQQRRAAKRGQASRDVIPIQVVPEPTTNTLLVTCTEEDFREIELFVAQMEDAFVEKEKVLELITPKFINYSQLMSTVNALYNPPGKYGVKRKEIEDIRAIPATGTSFFLECPKDKLADIKKLIETLDTEDRNQSVVRTYKLGDMDLAALTRMLQTTLAGKGTFYQDPQLGMLIVSAPEHRFEQIEKMMQQLKSDIEDTRQQFETITLKYARPSSVYSVASTLVSQQLSQRRSRRGQGIQLYLYPDDANNRLFVYAAPEEMALVKKMLETLDVENLRKEAELHTIPLERTDCEYMTTKISQLFTTAEQQRRAAKAGRASRDVLPIQIVPEPVTNSLLVTCTEEDFKDVKAFVDQMEKAFVEKEKVRELITPKYLTMSQLMSTVTALFNPPPSRYGKRVQRYSDISAIPATGSSFFLEAPKDKMPEVKKLIAELDVEDKNQPVVRTYKLGDMDLAALTRMLQTTLTGKGTFYQDPQLGMLIVSAPEHRFEQIEKMMQQLKGDIEETRQQFETITLKYARPSNVYGVASTLVSQQMSQRRSRRGQGLQLYLYPDDANNRLFVYAAQEEMALVKKMLETLDVENLRKEAELHTLTLKRTDCQYMASKIAQLFTQSEQQRRAVKRGAAARDIIPIQVVPEPTTNVLLITCTDEDFRDIELFVAQMEDAFVEKEKVRELVTPKFISYSQLMAAITAIYQPQGKTGAKRVEYIDVRVFPASGSSFYVEAPKDKMVEIKKLIEELDVEDKNQPIVRTYKLGDAVNVATLCRMLQTTMAGKGTFYPDPQLGMIIISAPEHRFEQIEKTMKQLKADIEETRQQFKVYPLKFAKASNIYGQLSSLVQTQASTGRSRRGLSVQLSIIPDTVLNRLFVYAGDEEMKLVEEMLKQFDIEGIEPETQVQSIQLANADCTYVYSMVTQMFTQQELERRRRGQTATAVQPLKVVPDSASNRLLIWASPTDYKDIEKFVREIDEQAADTKPERRIVSPKFIRVNELYVLIQSLFLSQRIRTGQRVRPVETTMSISGADLIMNGPKDRLDEIEAFIKTVDTEERAKMEIRSFSLPEVDLSAMVSTLQTIFSQDPRQQRGSMLFLPDVLNNELMVCAPKSLFKDIEEIINKKQEGAKKYVRKLTMLDVKHVDAGYLASMLTPLVTERTRMQRGRYAQANVTITPETRTNRLLIMAGEAETKVAEELIKELDTEAMGLKDQIHVLEIKKADVQYVASTLQSMATARAQLRRTRTYSAMPIYITAEPMTNRIFVAASEQDFKEVEKLAKEMDEAAESQGIQQEKIEVKYANPNTLTSTLMQMFQPLQTTGRRTQQDVRLTVAGPTIIAQAPAMKMVEIKRWIKELDVEDFADTQTKFFTLEVARPAEVQSIIQPMIQAKAQELNLRQGNRVQRSSPPMVLPDTRSNRLIVSGPSQILLLAEQLIKELDVEDPAWAGETVEIIEIEKAEAMQVHQVLQQLLRDREGQQPTRPRKGGGDIGALAVTIVPDAASNTLILKGLPRDVAKVKELVAEIEDKSVAGGVQFKLYRLKESDAEEVAKMVSDMVNAASDPRTKRNPVQVSSNYMMNSVFVAGTSKQQTMVQKVIDMFEKPEMEIDPNTGEMIRKEEHRPFEFIRLEFSDAYDIKYDLEGILEKRYPPKKGPTLETLYDDPSVLMIYGKPDEIRDVKQLVKMFEDKNRSKPPITRTLELRELDATKLMSQLKDWGYLKDSDKTSVIGAKRPESLIREISIEDAIQMREDAEKEKIEKEKEKADQERKGVPATQPKRSVRTSGGTTPAIPAIKKGKASRFVAPSILITLAAELNGIVSGASAPAGTQPAAPSSRPAAITVRMAQTRHATTAPSAATTKPAPIPVAPPPPVPAPKPLTPVAAPAPAAAPVPVAAQKPAASAGAKPKEPAVSASPKAAPTEAKPQEPAVGVTPKAPATPAAERPTTENRFSARSSSTRDSKRDAADALKPLGIPGVQVMIDEKTGLIQISGPERRVKEMEDLVKRLQEEMAAPLGKELEYKVYQPKHIDVSVAAALLDRIFNEPRAPVVPQPQQPQPGKEAKGAKKDEGEKEERSSLRDLMKTAVSSKGAQRMRIIPDTRLNYLIVVASPEMQKDVVDLLAKVDVPGQEYGVIRYYHLENLSVSEVEQGLKTILGVEGRRQAAPRVPAAAAAPGQAQNVAIQQLQEQIQQLQGAGGEMSFKLGEQITITSNTTTNTLVVMAPEKAMQIIDEYINTLEDEASKSEIEALTLDSANAAQVAQTMMVLYGRQRSSATPEAAEGAAGIVRSGGGSRVRITAESSTNTLYIKAPEPLRKEIVGRIKALDEEAIKEGKPVKLLLSKADPEVIAPKLQQAFVGRGQKRGKEAVTIIGDNASNSLIIRAPESVRKEIEELAKAMDVEGTDTDIRIFELKFANAVELHQQLTTMTQQVIAQLRSRGQKNAEMEVFAAVPDPRTNTLVVTGGVKTFQIVEKVLKQIDVPPTGSTEKVTVVYQLEQAQAADVARAIGQLYQSKRGQMYLKGGHEPPTAEYDTITNTVMIRATELQQKQIKNEVIDKLEEFSKTKKIKDTTIELKFAKSDETAQMLTEYFTQRSQSRRGLSMRISPSDVVTILSEPNLNALLVRCNDENLETIKTLVARIDQEGVSGKGARQTKVRALEFADPAQVSQAIRQAFLPQAGVRQGLRDRVEAVPEYTTGSLVLIASEENMKRIDEILNQLDTETATKRETKKIALQHAHADEVQLQLTQLYAQTRGRTRQGQLPVTVTADDRTNSVIVSAKKKDLEELEKLIQTMDVPSEQFKTRLLKTFQLEWAEPYTVAQMINQAFASQSGRRGPTERVLAAAEYSTGSLVVSASPENMKLVDQLIKDVDKEGSSTKQMHVVEIKSGEAADIALALSQMFVQGRQAKRGGQPPITIVNPQGTNKVMVMASEADFKKIADAIKEMDVDTKETEVRIVRLTHISPEEAQTVLQEYLRKPGRTGKWDTTLQGDVRISISDSVGGLVLTARKEKLEELEALIKKIDVETPEGAAGTRKIEIFPLEFANPYTTATAIQQTFAPRRGAGAQSESDRVVATAETSTNAVIISASEKNLVRIRKFIKDLDQEDKGGREVHVMTLKKARATDVAATLTQTYRSRMRTQRGEEPITVTAEPGTNSLIISAKKSELKEVEELVTQMDVDPSTNEEMKVIPLDHIDAAEALTIMQDYLKRPTASGARGDLAGGTRVSSSDSMNALVISGKKENMVQLEAVVKGLDQPTAQADREPKIIPLKAARAGILAGMLSQIFTDPATQKATRRRGATAAEMVPIIMADETSNTVIVRARKTDFGMIEKMAAQLDREDLGGQIRVIPVPPTIDVTELAQTIEQTVNQGERNRAQQTGKRAALVSIGVDDRTNSLIIAGPAEQFAQVERLVKDLQDVKPAGEPTMKVLRLKRLQATELKQVLDQMMERQTTKRRGRSAY